MGKRITRQQWFPRPCPLAPICSAGLPCSRWLNSIKLVFPESEKVHLWPRNFRNRWFFFLFVAFTQQTATISHDALSGCLVFRPPISQAPSQVQASQSWSRAALQCLQSRMHHRQQYSLQDSLTHTHTHSCGHGVGGGDLTSRAQQALFKSPPPPPPNHHLFF